MSLYRAIRVIAVVSLCTGVANGAVQTIDFNSLLHGEIVNNQFGPYLSISAVNGTTTDGRPDLAIAFDSGLTGTRDPDLEGPASRSWAGGNIPTDEALGTMLIIAENDWDGNNDGLIDNPDDEGNHTPAGSLFFKFNSAIDMFGFDFIDFELDEDGANSYLEFSLGGTLLSHVDTGEFVKAGSPFLQTPAVVYGGDNYANRLWQPITSAALAAYESDSSITEFDQVEIRFWRSGAVDNIKFNPVPLPAAVYAGLSLLGSMGMFRMVRRFRSRSA